MTLPDNAPVRKPRRLGLLIPWGLAGVFALAWCMGWFWLEHEAVRKMDAARASIEKAGWRFDWTGRKVSGFPFRLNVDLTNARWGEASGWSVTAPVLKAQAYVSSADHWIMVAPQGVVLTRPNGGPVNVGAGALRASLSHLDQHPPMISVEAMNLTFKPADGAAPFPMSGATEFHLHTKPGPDNQGAFYVEVDRPTGLSDASAANPDSLAVDVIYSHADAMRGRDVGRALESWRAAGGTFGFHGRGGGPKLFVTTLADLIEAGDGSTKQIVFTATRSTRR